MASRVAPPPELSETVTSHDAEAFAKGPMGSVVESPSRMSQKQHAMPQKCPGAGPDKIASYLGWVLAS